MNNPDPTAKPPAPLTSRPEREMLSILDPKWILFVKVTELGSLTHASAVLNSPQSAISRQIGILERECGARLFRRTGRGVVLTDFGEKLFPQVKTLIVQSEQLSDDIRTFYGEPLGTVRIGILPSTVPRVAGHLLREASRRLPKVRLHFTEGSSVQLEDWLNQGRLDLSFLLREDEIEHPDEPTLRQTSLSLIGPRHSAISGRKTVEFSELAELPLVLPGEPHLLRARLNALASQRNMKLNVVMQADSIQLQEEVAAAGAGYAIVVARMRGVEVADRLSTALIINPELPRRMVLCTTSLRPQTLAMRAVAQLILDLRPQIFV